MSNIQIFNYQNNEVRTVEMGGEPWFVLKDVCGVLDIADHKVVARRLDEDEVCQTPLTDSMGRQQSTTIINESGLYHVILRSDKPEAAPFRKWVTSEVLPSIRKNGGYIAGQEQLTVEKQIMQPKAEYFDELVDRNLLTNFRETAKELGIKPKAFVAWLLEKKFLYRDQKGKLLPREDKNNGLFEVKEAKNDKTQWSGVQTLITPKGRETFRLLYL